MEIKGFLETSFLDWDGKVSAVIFLPGCNFRCPFCHNFKLVQAPKKFQTIPFSKVKTFLEFNKDFIDGVVITGGEPTIHPDLPELCRKIKDIGLNIKLDTNGTNPNMLKQLVNSKLVDYVAMDIKAPLDFNAYSKACGIKSEVLFEAVKYSARYLLTNPVDYEFRTTVVPSLHTTADIRQISVNIRGARRYFIQNFVSYNTLDASCSSLTPFDEKQIRAFVNAAQDNVPNTKFRGKFSSLE